MNKFKYKSTWPRVILFTVLLVSSGLHFAKTGFKGVKQEEIWLGIVLLVALLGSFILKLVFSRKRKG